MTMRNMSFSMTTEQVRNGTKTVTRRFGWDKLKTGDEVMAVEKGMGLKKGEKIVKIRPIRIIDNKKELVSDVIYYGTPEMAKEGFPEMTGTEFVEMLCKSGKKQPYDLCNRIEFEDI